MDKRVTEIFCHECRGYIRIALDHDIDGNHIIKCPECGHEHCRVIKAGEITGDRWQSRNQTTTYTTSSTSSYCLSAFVSSSTISTTTNLEGCFFKQLWLDSTV